MNGRTECYTRARTRDYTSRTPDHAFAALAAAMVSGDRVMSFRAGGAYVTPID